MLLELGNYNRFFAFGCSYTAHLFPTWADIVAAEMPNIEYYNFGQPGSGNLLISNRIAQANLKYKFNENDLVIVMFSTVCREDRYINGSWRPQGNIFTQTYYSESMVKEYCDPFGYLIRDAALIEMTQTYLKSLPCSSLFFSLADLSTEFGTLADVGSIDVDNNDIDKFNEIYSNTLKFPYMHTVHVELTLLDNLNEPSTDGHPLPDNYLEFLINNNFPLSDKGITYVNNAMDKISKLKYWDDILVAFPELEQQRRTRTREIF